MAITTYTGDTDYVSNLDDLPNDTGGLTPAQLKAVFDKFGTEFKAWFNETHVPQLTAEYLKYIGSSETTIKEAMEALVAGVVPDDSVTEAMLKAVLASKINGMLPKAGGTMTGAIVLSGAPTLDLHPSTKKYTDDGLALKSTLFPHETLTATWNESVNANTTVTKTIAHTLGVAPSKLLVNLAHGDYRVTIEVLFDGTNYNYRMSGYKSAISGAIYGNWKKSEIDSNHLIGTIGSVHYGTSALNDTAFRLLDLTVTDSLISFSIKNSDLSDQKMLACSVNVEVYA